MENPKTLLLPLITAELRNARLIKGLEDAGMVVEDFHIDLSTQILKLCGFTDEEINEDELYDFYFQNLQRIINEETEEFHEKLKLLAMEFCNCLLLEKVKRETGREECEKKSLV